MLKASFLTSWKLLLPLALLSASWSWTAASTPHVQAASIDVQQATVNRTKQDIAERWLQYRPLATGYSYMSEDQIYEVAPSLKPPYSAGTLKAKYIEDGVNAVNFMRYLAGLPDDVTPDWSLQLREQTAALVHTVNDETSQFPPTQPAGMDDSMYELGRAGSSSSNLIGGMPTFYDLVLYYTSDSSPFYIDRVEHRRSILNPSMKKTMFGMVYTNETYPFLSMDVSNDGRSSSDISYDYVAWPSAGYFPMDVFAPTNAWSVSLNPERYDNSRTDKIQVQLTRERDGRKWSFSSNDRDTLGRYFNVETSNYGIPFTVIFRPDHVDMFKPEDTYNVTITGVYTTSGQPASVSFQTKFFNLLPDLAVQNAIHLTIGETVPLRIKEGAQSGGNTFESSDPSVVTIDSQGRVKGISEGSAYVSLNNYPGNRFKLHVEVSNNYDNEQVSPWALGGYTKAKSNGLVSLYQDHAYQYPITRLEFTEIAVQMLEAVNGSSLLDDLGINFYNSPFSDVMNPSVTWAANNGIIQGTSSITFSPSALITREQAATLLLKLYDKALELKAAQTAGSPDSQVGSASAAIFVDDNRIASWARSSVYQAVGLKLMNGTGRNQFTPKGNLTYEQTFLIIENVFELVMK